MIHNLIFDADDTLWENNIYFLRATEQFLDIVKAHQLDAESVNRRLIEIEHETVIEYGYGTAGFTHSLLRTTRELLPLASPDVIERIEGLGRAIVERDEIDVLPGVEETLRRLRHGNRLFVITKGDDDEQRGKLHRSGLIDYFEHVDVVREKDVAAYDRFVDSRAIDPADTWMIGNSPKSDINPALAAGLNAVLIPHPDTWDLEIEKLDDPGDSNLHIVDSIRDLLTLFGAVPASGD